MAPPRRAKSTTNARAGRWRAAIIVAAITVAYLNSLHGPFLPDDERAIVNNLEIRDTATALTPPRNTPVAGRPLVNLSFAWNFEANGLDVTGYHVVNIAIHVVAALVLFGLVRRTLLLPRLAPRFGALAADIALACALLWGLHPLNTEPVNYLSQRTESMMGLFYLLTLYTAVRGWKATAVLACLAGMLCKESMATAPLVVLLYDRIFVFDSFAETLKARRGLYGGLAATWIVVGAILYSNPRTAAGFESGVSPWVYLLNQATLIPRYLQLSFWPHALVLDYGVPRTLALRDVLGPGVLVVGLILATVAALWFAPMAGFLGAAIFITLAPTSSIIPIATEVGAERRMYLPLAVLVILVVTTLVRPLLAAADPVPAAAKSRHQAILWLATGAVCVALAFGTMLRSREYASRLTLAQMDVARYPTPRGRLSLGIELVAAGRRDDGMYQLELAARDFAGARFALATEFLAQGKTEEARSRLEQFLRLMPEHVNAPYADDMLGRIAIADRRFEDAVREFRILKDDFPSYPGMNNDVQVNLGYALAAAGHLKESIPILEIAIDANPGNAKARDLLAHVQQDLAASATPAANVRKAD